MEDKTTIARDYSPSFGIPPIECLIIDRDDHLDSLASADGDPLDTSEGLDRALDIIRTAHIELDDLITIPATAYY